MQLIYGTGNQAKLDAMRRHLEELDIDLIGLKDLELPWPEVEEDGNHPLENARKKALAYHKICRQPVFSCDSGLFIEGLEDALQPGVHVRNVNGKRLSEQEMVEHYSAIAKSMGGICIARYQNAICLVISEDEIYECAEDDISGEKFGIVDMPHPDGEEGFPIDRLSIHLESGRYYHDIDELDLVSSTKAGFVRFFRKALHL